VEIIDAKGLCLDVKRPFGASVRTWRKRLHISQEELAGRAGLHRTYICDVERGARNVSLESIEKLAHALEISTATLFCYSTPPGQLETSKIPGEGLVDILFVEDDPHDIELTKESLKTISNAVQVVRDGEAALNFLFCRGEFAHRQGSQRPQLVLLDLGLPKIDGLEVLQCVKSNPLTANIPVVVLTGSDRDRDIRTSKRLGAAAYIIKPVDMLNLAVVAPILQYQWALVKPPPRLQV
jgi:CheY-like chemotaxis protein